MSSIAIARIRLDGGTQTRASIREDVVEEYAALNGVLPGVTIFYDGKDYWLSDGFHRIYGAKKSGKVEIEADIRQGTQRDAILFSVRANATHGLRRTNEDKRRAVTCLLSDPEWSKCSNAWVAEMCAVSDILVKTIRKEISKAESADSESCAAETQSEKGDNSTTNSGGSNSTETRTGKDGKKRPATTKILCAKCTRVGEVKGCPGCKALRSSGGCRKRKKPEEPTEESGPKDAFGVEVPKSCRDAFCDPFIQDTIDFLAEMGEDFRMQRIADGMAKRAKHYPFIGSKDVIDGCGFIIHYFDELLNHFKEHRPVAVCPACAGKKCSECRGTGLLPRDVYEQLKGVAK